MESSLDSIREVPDDLPNMPRYGYGGEVGAAGGRGEVIDYPNEFHCHLCGDVTKPWKREYTYGVVYFNETCKPCREAYYNKAVNRHGKRERYCIKCGINFKKKTKSQRVGHGRKVLKQVEFCTSCCFCVDCRHELGIHDARKGRF